MNTQPFSETVRLWTKMLWVWVQLQSPTQTHWIAVKRIMRYLNGTPDLDNCILQMTTLLDSQMQIGLEIMITKNQHLDSFLWCVVLQSAGIARSKCVLLYQQQKLESIWLQRLLLDMKENSVDPMTIFEDNQSTIAMTKNAQHHDKVKHINIKFHYIRECYNE